MNRYTEKSFEDLVVYQQALQFVMAIYGLVALFPKNDLPSQITLVKESAIAITTNIAESSKKNSSDEKIR